MKNLITAIGNPYINEIIKKRNNYNVILKDIQYQEGVIDILKIYKNIEILLISPNIFGEKEFTNFIDDIRSLSEKIEIVVFKDKNDFIDMAYLNSKNIYKIFTNDEVGYDEYLKNMNNNEIFITEQVKKESNNFKKEILKKQTIGFEKNHFFIKKKNQSIIPNKDAFSKSFLITGERDIGKSTFIVMLSKYIENKNKTVLILDTCKQDYSISLIFGNTITQKVQKVSKNITYMKYENLEEKNDYKELKKIMEKLKEEFDFIVVDTNFEKTITHKNIINICDNIIFLIEPNFIGIKKAKRILEVYEFDFKIPTQKIEIIFNKVSKHHISSEILKEVFDDYKIIEYIKYNSKYSLYMHKNTKHCIEDDSYKLIYEKIFE